jgi:polar amino acid transport system substrate-binding protein
MLCLFALALPPLALQAAAPDLVMVAPMNLSMPLAQYQKDKLVGGILKDMGETLAQRLGRSVRFVSVPGEAVSALLTSGKADGICFVRPHWIDGEFDWSAPFMHDAEMIAARAEAPQLRSLADLRDRPIGSVASHRYPRIENVLGLRFARVDSTNVDESLRKLLDGTVQYALMGRTTMEFHARNNKTVRLRADLIISTFEAQCAFSKKADVPFSEVDKAINGMLRDGSVERILSRYR